MDTKLTTTKQDSFDFRKASAGIQRDSTPHKTPLTPQSSRNFGSSGIAVRIFPDRKSKADDDRRAADRRGAIIEVDAQDPTWNASLPTIVVTSSPSPSKEFSRFRMPGNDAGRPKGVLCGPVVRKDSGIDVSLVQVCLGEGGPMARLNDDRLRVV